MLKVTDNRKTNERQLKDIKLGGFFLYKDALCRRTETPIKIDQQYLYEHDDEILITIIESGDTVMLYRDVWVEPVRDEQVTICLED